MNTPSPKKLIIFGCGYIGTALAKQSLERGLTTCALTRNPQKADGLRQLGVHQVIKADLASDAWHRQLDPEADYVLNCVSSAGGGIEGYRQSYWLGQKSIASWASKGKVRTWVYTGSTSVYPQTDGSWVDENSPVGGNSPTSEVLLEAEQVMKEACKQMETRWFVLRLAGIYGPERHSMLALIERGRAEFPGNGKQFLNLIHRDDCCSAIWAAFESEVSVPSGRFNVSDGHPAPKESIANWLAKALGQAKPQFFPDRRSSRMSQRLFGSSPPNRRIDHQRMCTTFGWKPKYPSFVEGYEALLKARVG